MKEKVKDVLPVAGNSADKRRPLIMVSPRERQNRRKNNIITSPVIEALQKQIEELNIQLEEATKVVVEKVIVAEPVAVVDNPASEYKKELAKLKKELTKKDSLIQELQDKLPSTEDISV